MGGEGGVGWGGGGVGCGVVGCGVWWVGRVGVGWDGVGGDGGVIAMWTLLGLCHPQGSLLSPISAVRGAPHVQHVTHRS